MASTMLALAPDSTQMESLALVTLTNVELQYQMTQASTLTVRRPLLLDPFAEPFSLHWRY